MAHEQNIDYMSSAADDSLMHSLKFALLNKSNGANRLLLLKVHVARHKFMFNSRGLCNGDCQKLSKNKKHFLNFAFISTLFYYKTLFLVHFHLNSNKKPKVNKLMAIDKFLNSQFIICLWSCIGCSVIVIGGCSCNEFVRRQFC